MEKIDYECEFCEIEFSVNYKDWDSSINEPKCPRCGKSGDVIPK